MKAYIRVMLLFIGVALPLQAITCEKNKYPFHEERRPLVHAIDACDLKKIRALLSRGADPHDFDGTNIAPIHIAAGSGSDVLRLFLSTKVNVELKSNQMPGWTPLFYSIDWGRVESVRLLIKAGANVNARSSYGDPVLHYAAGLQQPNAEIIEALIMAGAHVNAMDRFSSTPLLKAFNSGDIGVVEMLLKYGAEPNVQDVNFGMTALHYAMYYGDRKLVELLLEHKADPGIRDKHGRLPEDIAREKNYHDLVVLLANARRRL